MTRPKVTVLGCWGLATIGETPSFLIESEEGSIVLDLCPGVTRQLKRLDFNLNDLDLVFASHCHADHMLGATYLIFQHSVEQRELPEDKKRPLEFIGPKSVLSGIDNTVKIHYPERAFTTTNHVLEGNQVDLSVRDNVRLKFAICDHTVECYAVRIELLKSQKVIVYTSDGIFNEHVENLAQGADLLIGEAFGAMSDYEKAYQNVKHSLGVHLGELAKNAGVKAVLPFHMHPRYGSDMDKKSEIISEIKSSYDGEIVWPGDLSSGIV